MKASASLILDLIEDKNFNKYSLYEDADAADPTKYGKATMSRLRKYLRSAQIYIAEKQRTGSWPVYGRQKVHWHLDTDFDGADDEELEKQIWKTIRYDGPGKIDDDYSKLTQ